MKHAWYASTRLTRGVPIPVTLTNDGKITQHRDGQDTRTQARNKRNK